MRGIPQIYYGDEIGLPGGEDPDNRRDFPGGFPGDTHNAFTQSGRTADEQDIFAYVKQLLHLRLEHIALRRRKQWFLALGKDYFAFARVEDHDRLMVIFNSADHPTHVRIDFRKTPFASATRVEAEVEAPTGQLSSQTFDVNAPARTVLIYRIR